MAENWGAFDWRFVLPPNRPSQHQLEVVAFAARTAKAHNVAVLGCTPEYRDLFAGHGLQFTLFERDPASYAMMTALCSFVSRSETIAWVDWTQEQQDYKGAFDLIVSDLTLGNVPYDDRGALSDFVEGALRKDGLFVDRVLTLEASPLKLADLDLKYQHLPRNLRSANDFSSEYLFCSELAADAGMVDSSAFYDHLARRFVGKALMAGHADDAQFVTPRGATWYYGLPWNRVSDSYYPALKRVAEIEEERSSVFHGRAKTIVMRKS